MSCLCGFSWGVEPDFRIRGAHNGDSNDFSAIAAAAENGMNSVFVSMGGHLVSQGKVVNDLQSSPELLALLNQWQSETELVGLQFFPMVELYGTGDRKRWPLNRWLVTLEGEDRRHTPCPLDPDLWENRLGTMYVELARWAKSQPNVPGILMDTEMYGADKVGYHDACFCKSCQSDIAGRMKVDASSLNLNDAEMLAQYREISGEITQEFAANLRKQVHNVYPNCILGGYLLDYAIAGGFVPPIYKAMTRGWGTAENPVRVFSEVTYEFGYHAVVKDGLAFLGDRPGHIDDWQQRWEEWGAHATFVGGLWITRIPPENIAENIYYLGANTGGYWFYDLISLGTKQEDFFALPGEGASEYWPEIARGNAELDRHAADLAGYTSPLVIRPFTLPAPGIDLSRWTPLNLPQLQRIQKDPEFRFFGQEEMIYLSAAAGDTVRFTVVSNDIASGRKSPKKDAVAIVIVDPSGKIIQREKLTVEDLKTQPQPDSRFGGSREVEFQSETTGNYCIFLKGIRYTYNLGKSTHPWAAMLVEDRPSNLWQVRRFHVKSDGTSATVHIPLTLGRESDVTVRDASGKQLLKKTIKPDEQEGLTVKLSTVKPTPLTVIIDGDPNGTIEAGTGLEPWISAATFK